MLGMRSGASVSVGTGSRLQGCVTAGMSNGSYTTHRTYTGPMGAASPSGLRRISQTGRNEAFEKRVRSVWLRKKFWVELASNKPGMIS